MTTSQTTINVRGTEHPHARAAIQAADKGGDPVELAITIAGRFFTVERGEADRLAESGVFFAYLFDQRGTVVTVPIND
jgi:hypothetical protein